MLKDKITINGLELNNRLVLPPMMTLKADPAGNVTSDMLEYYSQRASGGLIGLIVTEHCFVCPQGRAGNNQMSMSEGVDLDALRRLTDAIHACGSKVIAQINHAGSSANPEITGMPAVAPSAVVNPRRRTDVIPEELSADEIAAIEDFFADAAERVKASGFDGVEIHAAHTYLFNQFYSPLSNKRTDLYGCASVENRIRIILETIEKVRCRVGNEFLIAVRLGGCDYAPGGSTIEDAVEACIAFERAGADLLDISGGMCGYVVPGRDYPGYFSDMTSAIKKSVNIPVILTGGIEHASQAEKLLEDGAADLIGVGRALYKDADWARKEL